MLKSRLSASGNWVDSGNLIYRLKVAAIRVARVMSGTNKSDEW